jgi:hypothetical protein
MLMKLARIPALRHIIVLSSSSYAGMTNAQVVNQVVPHPQTPLPIVLLLFLDLKPFPVGSFILWESNILLTEGMVDFCDYPETVAIW